MQTSRKQKRKVRRKKPETMESRLNEIRRLIERKAKSLPKKPPIPHSIAPQDEFPSADHLGISPYVRHGLTNLLAMMERGDIVHALEDNTISHGINLASPNRDISYWVRTRVPWFGVGDKFPSSLGSAIPIREISLGMVGGKQIMKAIQNYLTYGDPRWVEVVDPQIIKRPKRK